MKKINIPQRWSQQYNSVSASPTSHVALKTAIEEIGLLEAERAKLLEENELLEPSLKDLQECRKQNMEH